MNSSDSSKPETSKRERGAPFSEPTHVADADTSLRERAPGETTFSLTDWALVVFDGFHLGRLFPLTTGENTIGRSELAHVALFDAEVSRVHAYIELNMDGAEPLLTLRDAGSKNGTFLNHRNLLGPSQIYTGDRIGIGSHLLKLVALDAKERAFYEKLLDQSTKDALTGLWNRGAIMDELQSRFLLCHRHGRPLSLILCDLDLFKQVNDTFGHGAGDLVLTGFGELIHQTLRTSDRAGRIGGEEFLLVLPETDTAGALLLAERLRALTEARVYNFQLESKQVTCSFGVARQLPSDKGFDELLARVDEALYRAKREGRNRVVAAADR